MKKRIKYSLYSLLSIAIAFNAILPLFFSSKTFSDLDIDALKKLYGEDGQVLICTSFGYKYVGIDEIYDEQDSNQKHSSNCPLCLITSAKIDLSASEAISLNINPVDYKPLKFNIFDELKISSGLSLSDSNRAPPYIS